ncbi:MAG: hypothetical protein RH860_06045 [Cytophagales bacterium]
MSEKFILNNIQINQKIKRMAYEIYEDNYNAKHITIVEIDGQGLAVAKALHKELENRSCTLMNLFLLYPLNSNKTHRQLDWYFYPKLSLEDLWF